MQPKARPSWNNANLGSGSGRLDERIRSRRQFGGARLQRNTDEVISAAPLDSVQKMFAQHFDAPLNRVDYRVNGLRSQKYIKDCINASL